MRMVAGIARYFVTTMLRLCDSRQRCHRTRACPRASAISAVTSGACNCRDAEPSVKRLAHADESPLAETSRRLQRRKREFRVTSPAHESLSSNILLSLAM